jgi:copper chaperone
VGAPGRTAYTQEGYTGLVTETITYTVPGMHCGHCERAVKEEVGAVSGVEAVDVDLERKLVRVHGDDVDDAAVRAAIGEAGYDVV